MGSRNGTLVNGEAIDVLSVVLRVGVVITLGTDDIQLRLETDGPPVAWAYAGETQCLGEPEMLALPSPDNPLLVVHLEPTEGWLAMGDDASRVVGDGEVVLVDGQEWTLRLPQGVVETVDARAPVSEQPRLEVRVSEDEEDIEVWVHSAGAIHQIPTRRHHELLLLLARARVADLQAVAAGASSTGGWLYYDELPKMLNWKRNTLYVCAHRCRKDFDDFSTELFERRAASGKIRLALNQVDVVPLEM